jgi:hypothetical protein
MFNFDDAKSIVSVLKFPPFNIFLSLVFKYITPQRNLKWGFHCILQLYAVDPDQGLHFEKYSIKYYQIEVKKTKEGLQLICLIQNNIINSKHTVQWTFLATTRISYHK